MIVVYVVAEGATPRNRADRREWGRIEDGAIVATTPDAAADVATLGRFEPFCRRVADDLVDGLADPVAVVRAVDRPRVVAGVPDRHGLATYGRGDEYALATRGDLGPAERDHVAMYENLPFVQFRRNTPRKNRVVPERYRTVAVYELRDDGYVPIGEIDADDGSIEGERTRRYVAANELDPTDVPALLAATTDAVRFVVRDRKGDAEITDPHAVLPGPDANDGPRDDTEGGDRLR
ncbi:hypothetical protein BRD17_00305 [Halobacteriales archaeon SW_7_68_16]|nr:MAG: hypothetical protein BRD17_00305 [Halobacteriales archaeon SW_7_68_16]